MIDINDLRFSAANSVRDLALLPSEVLELLDRLEAAEKERDWHAERCEDAMNECDALRTAVRHESDCVEAAKTEIKALRAKTVLCVPDAVMAALDNLDDYIARIEGNDRGACNHINLLRRYLLDATEVGENE
jgi:hypothetical protein